MDRSSLVMPLIVLAGLVIVPAVACMQARTDPREALEQDRIEHDRLVAKELARVGFAPHAAAGPDRTDVWAAEHPIVWSLANGEITADAPSQEDIARATAMLARELTRYPQGFFAAKNMSRVLLCAHLKENGHDIPSLPNIDGAWLLDATLGDSFAARVTHHELYHFIDLADDGTLTADARWESINPSGFSYGAGGRSLRAAWASEPSSAAPGFVSAYAVSAVAEDKAETFALWMTQPHAVAAMASQDRVVARKLVELRGRLAED